MNIVFDLDGTLIDSAPDIQHIASAVLARHGAPALTLDETRCFVGEGAPVLVSRLMAARGIEDTPGRHAQLLEEFKSLYPQAVGRTVFYPGVEDALAALRARGHSLGLCTNKPEVGTSAVLRYMGLEDTFGAVMAGDMLDTRKPEPEMLLLTIERLGGGASLFVGDSEIDARTALHASVPFALFTRGYRKAPVAALHHDWAFDDYGDLPAIIDRAARELS